jgi:hypothetical protein
MGKWKFSFPIDGLHDVIQQKGSTSNIDEVIFRYRGEKERVGTVIIDANTLKDAEKESKYLINKALGKICFAFNTEASPSLEAHYYKDLTNNQKLETVCKSVGLRWSYVKEDSDITLKKMKSLKPEKQDKLDLALAYYKLGEYKNPLRIECFFSSITVLVRELSGKDHVYTHDIRDYIKLVLRNRDPTIFNESEFENQWKEYYIDERCSIAHGRGSKLIDPRTIPEYDEMTRTISYWTREVIYYYIDNFQNLK